MTGVTDDKTSPTRVGKRYQVIDEIGSGGYGTVYRARDEMSEREVAIKVLDASASSAGVSAWREAASLRRLNLPGVIELLDEGIWNEQPYLVMPIIDGMSFPGSNGYGVGEFPADTILALVEVLTLVHAEGIVHGDLKPQNVLVGDDGRVTLLDFGTGSWTAGHPVEHRLKRTRGTPAYMSPEQLRGHRATVQSDYYALGIMLYHVITGEFPHPIESIEALTRARLSWRAPHLDPERLGISPRLARAVEGLLAPAASRRLAHLRELVDALDASRGDRISGQHFNEYTLRFLDPNGLLDRAVSAIERGESVDIVGRNGAGKTRFLHELTRRLRDRDGRVISLIASARPFGSLAPLIGTAKIDGIDAVNDVDAMHRSCREEIEQALASGKVLVADTFEKIDPRTRELLEVLRDKGGVVRARLDGGDEAIELAAFTSQELEQLFDGPEPIFRSRSAAAHQLWLRSGGHPRSMVREVDLWVRHGLAHFRADKLVVPAQQLERLRRGLQLHAPASAMAIFADDIDTRTLLVWIKLAGRYATVGHLAPLIGVEPAQLHSDVERLIERDALTCSPDGVLVPMVDAMANCPLSAGELENIHKTLADALAPGTSGRLLHLLRAGTLDEIIDEARASAQHHDRRGEVGPAIAALTEAVWACHQFNEFGQVYALVADWAKIALASSETTRLEELLYAIEQLPLEGDPQLAHLEALVNLGRIASQRTDEDTLERLDALAPFDDWELELRRHMCRMQVVATRPASVTNSILKGIERWVDSVDEPEARGSLIGWRSVRAFQQGRFLEAAALSLRAASIKNRPTARLASLISASTALMDAGEYADALKHSQRALELAERLHHHHYHGYTLRLVRDIRYRLGEQLSPTPELGEALRLLGIPLVLGRHLLTEAVIHWRADRLDDARRLSHQAARAFDDARNHWGATLSEALELRCTNDVAPEAIERLGREATECPSARLGAQILGLILHHTSPRDEQLKGALRELAASIQKEQHAICNEIISVSEAMDALD
jgi:tetratricopeptide (TPR) repeat protein